MTRAASLAATFALLAGCAAHPNPPRVGLSDVPESDLPDAEPPAKPAAEPPADIVERSALPIAGLRTRDGKELSDRQLFDELSRFDAVCIGESHDNPHDHYAELALLREIERRASHRGEELGVGFEMFQVPFQTPLNAYVKGDIDERALLAGSEYDTRWGFPFAYYRPLLEFGREHGLQLLALNARRELTRSIARGGLDKLSPDLARELPELDMADERHRKAFDHLMQGHPEGHGSPEHLYAAQVVWDETMADRAAAFLAGAQPARKLLIMAGRAHCSKPAVPARLERRTALRVASVLPSVGKPADSDGYDYALVMKPLSE